METLLTSCTQPATKPAGYSNTQPISRKAIKLIILHILFAIHILIILLFHFLTGLHWRPQLPQGILPHGSRQVGIELGIVHAHVPYQLLDLLAHRMAVMGTG